MERDEDPSEEGPTALELAEMKQRDLILSGRKLESLELSPEALRQLEAECAPCTVEEYFDVPIYVRGRQ